jgi:hypothetical protein
MPSHVLSGLKNTLSPLFTNWIYSLTIIPFPDFDRTIWSIVTPILSPLSVVSYTMKSELADGDGVTLLVYGTPAYTACA